MRRIIISLIILCIFYNLSAMEQEGILTSSTDLGVWKRVDGPYVPQSINELFFFNNNLFVSSHSHQNVNFQHKDEEWVKVTEGMLSDCGRVFNFKEKNNVKILSAYSGIYVSYNDGLDWDIVEPLDGRNSLYSVAIVGETIFAQKHYFNSSLHKLEKNSKKWEKLYFSDGVDSIFADRLISSKNYIITGDYDYEGRHKTGGGIAISSDKGLSWYKLTNFNQRVHSMVFYNEVLFVGASDRHLYKSSNYGESWEVDTNHIFPVDLFYTKGDNLFATVNSVGSQDSITTGIHLSTDNGKTWERRHEGIGAINISTLLSFESKLYCLDKDDHVYESDNNGINWERSKILTDSINSLDILLHNDTLFAGALQFGIVYSTDDGTTWDIFSESLIKNKSISPTKIYKNDNIFAAISNRNNEYIVSSDGGKNWERGNIGIINFNNPPINDGNVFEDKFILATDVGLKYTTDFGENWYDIYGGELDSEEAVSRIIKDEYKSLYISTFKGLLESKDKGKTWDIILTRNNEIENNLYYYIKVEKNVIYAFDGNYNILTCKVGEEKWYEVSSVIDEYPTPHKIFNIQNSLIIVVGGGIIISTNEGKDWIEYLLPLNKPNGNPYDFNQCVVQGNYIIAATEMGILRAKLTDIGITPTSVETERNYLYTLPPYPLPAKSEVKVQFYWDINLPMTIDDISIYDLNGREIQTKDKLQIDKQASHYGNLIWDCSNEQTGIYIINISHGTEERAVKVVVE